MKHVCKIGGTITTKNAKQLQNLVVAASWSSCQTIHSIRLNSPRT